MEGSVMMIVMMQRKKRRNGYTGRKSPQEVPEVDIKAK
jgi:hypothetical protein